MVERGGALEALLANVGSWSWIGVRNLLLSCGASKLTLADRVDFTRKSIDSDGDLVAVKTGAFDDQFLTSLCVALLSANLSHRWHYLDIVALASLEVAGRSPALVDHGVTGATERCSHLSGRVALITLNDTCHQLVSAGNIVLLAVETCQVEASTINSEVNRQVAGLLILDGTLRLDCDSSSHTWVDNRW